LQLIEKFSSELDVFILDELFSRVIGLVGAEAPVPCDPSRIQTLLFSFYDVDHRAGDRLLAFECGDRGPSPDAIPLWQCRPSPMPHCFGCARRNRAPKAFVSDDLVFYRTTFARERIPLRIDLAHVDLSFPGVLISVSRF